MNPCLGRRAFGAALVAIWAVAVLTRSSWQPAPELAYIDDRQVAFSNPDVAAMEREGLFGGRLWKNDFWGTAMSKDSSHQSYRPVAILALRCMWHPSKEVFVARIRRTNLLLHGLVSALFAAMASEHCFLRFKWSGMVAGLLFAAHPVHTEAVCSAVGVAELLAALFFLCSFVCFNKAVERSPEYVPCLWLAGHVGFSVLAVFSKEHGITVVLVCAVHVVLQHVQRTVECTSAANSSITVSALVSRRLAKTVTLLACEAVLLLYWRLVFVTGGLLPSPVFQTHCNPVLQTTSRAAGFETAAYLWYRHALLLLRPVLCPDWSMGTIPPVTSVLDSRNVGALVLLAGIFLPHVLLFVRIRGHVGCKVAKPGHKKSKERLIAVVFALQLAVLPFLPASNIAVTVGFAVAERVMYIPSMGFCLVFAWFVEEIVSMGNPTIASLSVITTVAFAVSTSWTLSSNWNTSAGLYAAGSIVNPSNPLLYFNTALEISFSDSARAMKLFNKALELWPREHSPVLPARLQAIQQISWESVGLQIVQQNANITQKRKSANNEQELKDRAVRHFNLGTLYSQSNWSLSEHHFRRALGLRPHKSQVGVLMGLGRLMSSTQRHREAANIFQRVLKLQPVSGEARALAQISLRYADMQPASADVSTPAAQSTGPHNGAGPQNASKNTGSRDVFEAWVQRTSPAVRQLVIKPSETSDRIAVIVEGRKHPMFWYVVRNVMHFLGQEWRLQVFCVEDNKSWLHEQLDMAKGIRWTVLPTASMVSAVSYSKLLLSQARFWEQLPEECENVLLFQTDSVLLRPGIEAFMEFDYVGAPWSDNQRSLQGLAPRGGNGGLSFRHRSAAILALSAYGRSFEEAADNLANWTIQSQEMERGLIMPAHVRAAIVTNLREHPPEDCFFGWALTHLDKNLAPPRVQEQFSVEMEASATPLGLHAAWKYLEAEQMELLLHST
jgi:tetratricopeptide (TPR) repeat protein